MLDPSTKNELLHKIQVYSDNTDFIIRNSDADPSTKTLVQSISSETCNFLAAIINELAN